MEKITLNRKELYEKIWSAPIGELCNQYDIDADGLDRICRRLNVPVPEKTHWKKLAQGKKLNPSPLPEKSKGTERVSLYKRDDEQIQHDQMQKIKLLLNEIDSTAELKDYSFDELILSTKEGIVKGWEERYKYSEKSKLLAVYVSPEALCRALQILDLLMKVLQFKGHELIVEKSQTFVVIDGEKIEISLGEKNRRVEYIDEYEQQTKDYHPSGVLYLKKDGRSYSSKQWKDGPRKGLLEDQLLNIVDDLVEIAREQKEENERWKKSREEQAERDRIRSEHQKRQGLELAKFRQLLLDVHRFSLATMVRDYVNAIEAKATASNNLTDEIKEWILWARKRADWYDPTVPVPEDDLLDDIDVENLRSNDNYSGFNYSGYGYERRETNFWKPWWSK